MSIHYKHVVSLAVVGTATFVAFLPFPRTFVERTYSTLLYPQIQKLITPISNLTVLALFDVFVIAIIAVWLLALIRDIRRKRRWTQVIAAVLVRSTIWASALYIAFVFLWGFNYRRVKLRDKLQVDSRSISPEGAYSFASTAIDRLNALHDLAHAAEATSFGSIEPELANGFHRAQQELGNRYIAVPGRPKTTWLNPFFRLTGVEGMTDPYFLEILIDDSVLQVERPAVVAHEWGHLAGFADESEASFAGWLTCIHGSAADQYSGWLDAYREMMSAVRRADRAELARRLEPGPLEDLRASTLREQRQVSPLASHLSSQVYDGYLKANRIQSGVANYGEVVSLLLGVRFGPDWVPNRSANALP